MTDEILPTQPILPTPVVDTSTDENRQQKPNRRGKEKPKVTDDTEPKRPPKTGIIDEYV